MIDIAVLECPKCVIHLARTINNILKYKTQPADSLSYGFFFFTACTVVNSVSTEMTEILD